MYATTVQLAKALLAGQLNVRTMANGQLSCCYNCWTHSRVHSTFRTCSSWLRHHVISRVILTSFLLLYFGSDYCCCSLTFLQHWAYAIAYAFFYYTFLLTTRKWMDWLIDIPSTSLSQRRRYCVGRRPSVTLSRSVCVSAALVSVAKVMGCIQCSLVELLLGNIAESNITAYCDTVLCYRGRTWSVFLYVCMSSVTLEHPAKAVWRFSRVH